MSLGLGQVPRPVLSRLPMPFGHAAVVCRDGFEAPRHSGPALQAGAFGRSATCTLELPGGFQPAPTRARSPALCALSYGSTVAELGFEPRTSSLSDCRLCRWATRLWYRTGKSNPEISASEAVASAIRLVRCGTRSGTRTPHLRLRGPLRFH